MAGLIVTREQVMKGAGRPIQFSDHVETIAPATELELNALQNLQRLAVFAHGIANAE